MNSQDLYAMSSTPNPARIDEYRTKLADLIATRNTFRDQGKDHKVKFVNRQIQAQLKWIKRAESDQL
jgi:hypothetical protein